MDILDLDNIEKMEVILTFSEKESEPRQVKQRAKMRAPKDVVDNIIPFKNEALKSLFIALCKRSGVKPFRYASQTRTTVVVRTSYSFFTKELLPRFQKYERSCAELAEQVMKNIASKIHPIEEDEVVPD